nr:O-antigen ligase family protein [Chloroflexota bacterium]
MNKEHALKGIRAAKHVLIGTLLVALTGAGGFFLGSLVCSPSWTNAVRLVGIVGVIAVILVILIDLLNGLLLWIVLEPYQNFWYLNIKMPKGVPDLSLSRLAIAFLFLIWVAKMAVGKKKLCPPKGVEIFMLMFCIMAVPSLPASWQGISATMQFFFDRLVIPFLVFILAKNLYEDGIALDKLIAALAVIDIYLCFMVFYEHITGQPLFYVIGRQTVYTQHLRKIVSLLGNPAYIATVLAMIFPMTFYKFIRASLPSSRAFYGILSILAALGNFFCYNRGGWLALVVAVLILMFFERRYRQILLPIILMVAVLVLVLWQPISKSAVVSERLFGETSIRSRMRMLEMGQKMVRDHLLFGVGFDNFSQYYIKYGGYWSSIAVVPPTPHNTYLLVLTTMGLVSFIPYVMLFVSMFLEIVSALRRACKGTIDRALLLSGWAVIAAYTVSAMFIDIYISTFTSLVFFCITGMILGYVNHLSSSPEKQRERP